MYFRSTSLAMDDCFLPQCVGWQIGADNPEYVLWTGAILLALMVLSAVLKMGDGADD